MKMLVVGLLSYMAYRVILKPFLMIGQNKTSHEEHEGDYIDYEEVD